MQYIYVSLFHINPGHQHAVIINPGQLAVVILKPFTSFLTQILGTLTLLENEALWLLSILTRIDAKVFEGS